MGAVKKHKPKTVNVNKLIVYLKKKKNGK